MVEISSKPCLEAPCFEAQSTFSLIRRVELERNEHGRLGLEFCGMGDALLYEQHQDISAFSGRGPFVVVDISKHVRDIRRMHGA